MEVIKIILKILWFILGMSYYREYGKTNNLKDYITYWGFMLLAILY